MSSFGKEEPLVQRPAQVWTHTAVNSQYAYKALDRPDQIRLLRVEPSSGNEVISCAMQTMCLDQPCHYLALSYSWAMDDGDASMCRSMVIDGYTTRITRNLYEGLSRIRKPDSAFLIWIDAVCINQEDKTEQSSQVSRMAEIYGKAERVIVWLGEGVPDQDRYFKAMLERVQSADESDVEDYFMRAIMHGPEPGWCQGETLGRHEKCRRFGPDVILSGQRPRRFNQTYAVDENFLDRCSKALEAMEAFDGRRYWKRRWVLQEFALASHQDWYWGDCSLLGVRLTASIWDRLSTALSSVIGALGAATTGRRNTLSYRLEASSIEMMLAMREESTKKSEIFTGYDGLVKALLASPAFACSDPRDSLYALLGICSPGLLEPDYTLSAADVYTKFAAKLVTNGLQDLILDLLQFDGWKDTRPLTAALPSWVPNLVPEIVVDYREEGDRLPFKAYMGSNEKTLVCELYRIGVVGDSIEPNVREMRIRWSDDCLVTLNTASMPNLKTKTGDLICASSAFLKKEGKRSELFVLRPKSSSQDAAVQHQKYTLEIIVDPLSTTAPFRTEDQSFDVEQELTEDRKMYVEIV